MAAAGLMDRRAAFCRPATATDGLGGLQTGWAAAYLTVAAELRPEKGGESESAMRVETRPGALLRIRSSIAARTIAAADSVVVDGRRWNIRSIWERPRSGVIELALEGAI